MSFEQGIITVLVFLLLLSHIYWPIVFFKFLDRYSSRDFSEYSLGKAHMRRKETATHQTPQVDESDPHAERQAEELNSLIGAI